MNRMVALAKGKREAEHRLAHAQALALARAGRLGAARAQSNRAWLSPFKKGMTKSQRARIFRMMMRKIIQFKLAVYCRVIVEFPLLGRGVNWRSEESIWSTHPTWCLGYAAPEYGFLRMPRSCSFLHERGIPFSAINQKFPP